jgi:hypothetical protein
MDMDELREMQGRALKAACATALSDGDWQVLRHLEQKAAGITASLSDDDFAALAQTRQSVRAKYHTLLAQVAAAQTEDDITAVSWD